MESLLTRLVTYKFMDGSSLVNTLIHQPIGKFLFSVLIFITIIGTSLYILHRTLFQNKTSFSEGSTIKKIDPQDLIDFWINQNRRFCVDLLNLCLAFVNSHTDRIKAPSGVRNISFLPRVSSSLMYSQMTSPIISANTMSIPVLITADRLSFSCQRQGNQKLSHIKFSLSNFSLEVVLNLSFNQTEILALRGVCSHPQFFLSIESPDPLENAKQDLMGTIEGIVANIPFIWKNADSLLSNQELYNGSRECDELFSDLDSIVINGDSEEVQKSFGEHEEKETFERPTELDVTSMDSFQETSSVGTALLNNGDAISKTVSQPFNDSADVTEIPHETVVLAHNPSLKKKLDSRRQRKHQRSASDFVETFEDETLPPETNFDDAEPVPLDPIVHPPEEQHLFLIAEPHQQPEFKSIPHQRMLKRVTDVSPLHERVAPNLASKNLLVKVVKADFIDLKSSSDAYCVVELDEPYQRHATHVVPPSEQLFWDQHLLFGLNSNSKRAAFEVFELSKRRKSISRGYAEVYLPDLLTSMVGGGSSELLRCISLDPKQHSSSTSGLLGGPGSGPSGGVGGGAWEFVSSSASSSTSLTIRKPTVTVEFHFMERIVDDPFSVCKGRSGIGSPVPHSKLRVAAPASSSDSSLSQTASGTASSDSGTTAAPTMPAAVTNVSEDRSPQGSKEKVSSGIGQSEAETPKDMTPTPNTDDNTLTSGQHESRLQRSTSTRGSRLFEPAFENLRIADTNAAALYARQHGKGFRRKSSLPRVLSSLGAGMGGSTTSSGFGLLGPSSQLAGVVAGLTAASVESSDASVDPSTAAAVASAVAVAAATGRSSSASIAVDRRGLGSAVGCSGTSGGMADSLFEGTGSSMATLGHPEHEPLGDTVVRYAAPAANVAESLGTYSAQPPLKRPDAAGTKLMNLFRPKRKQRPSGMARLLYLQNLEGSEFDAISTEGYQRIVHGDRTEKQ